MHRPDLPIVPIFSSVHVHIGKTRHQVSALPVDHLSTFRNAAEYLESPTAIILEPFTRTVWFSMILFAGHGYQVHVSKAHSVSPDPWPQQDRSMADKHTCRRKVEVFLFHLLTLPFSYKQIHIRSLTIPGLGRFRSPDF